MHAAIGAAGAGHADRLAEIAGELSLPAEKATAVVLESQSYPDET